METESAGGMPGSRAARACEQAGAGNQWEIQRDRMEGMLGAKRFIHSLAVADVSVDMGERFGGDPLRLAMAGLLHDGAKGLGDDRLLAVGASHGLITDPAERENPSLLHGPVAAWMAGRDWGVDDPVILEAIRYHTTGAEMIHKEACIVFMADLIEPGRSYPGVDILRRLCGEDLRLAMIEAIEQTFVYLAREQKPLHTGTSRCLAWLRTTMQADAL